MSNDARYYTDLINKTKKEIRAVTEVIEKIDISRIKWGEIEKEFWSLRASAEAVRHAILKGMR